MQTKTAIFRYLIRMDDNGFKCAYLTKLWSLKNNQYGFLADTKWFKRCTTRHNMTGRYFVIIKFIKWSSWRKAKEKEDSSITSKNWESKDQNEWRGIGLIGGRRNKQEVKLKHQFNMLYKRANKKKTYICIYKER